MDKQKTIYKVIAAVLIVGACLAFFLSRNGLYHLKDRGDLGPLTREDIEYQTIAAPTSTSMDGTINAADWAATYPQIVATMGANRDNNYAIDYLEQDPYLVNIYEGFGFAKDYASARGHEYTLEDVAKTLRPHGQAKCLTCKTPNFAKLVNDQGLGVYTMDFEEALALMEENVSCYSCHGNDAGNGGAIWISHSYVRTALGDNMSTIDPATLSCGQCHIEYYFTPDNQETMMPYHSIEEMTPDAILAYYDEMGFYDWIQESTGTKLLKAQHPEMETYLQGKHAALLNCADCHMAIEMDEDGTVYHSHYLASPLENETILSTCVQCHGDTDMVAFVHSLQDKVIARETEVGNLLSQFKDYLAEAVSAGKMTEEQLEEVRGVYRSAQWYFDFCYVENAEGAHNSDLAYYCLDKAEELINTGLGLLGK